MKKLLEFIQVLFMIFWLLIEPIIKLFFGGIEKDGSVMKSILFIIICCGGFLLFSMFLYPLIVALYGYGA